MAVTGRWRQRGLRKPEAGLARTLGPPDPLSVPPRGGVAPNPNPPVGSVGPNVPVAGDPSAQDEAAGGFGATHVMYPEAFPPPQAQAWAGWPSEWAVPWNNAGGVVGGVDAVNNDVVWACIDTNATAVADMPPYVLSGGIRQPNPSWMANPEPQVYTHWGEFMRQCWWSYQAVGEVFIAPTSRFADSTGPFPRTFLMLAPWLVTVDLVDGQRRYGVGSEDLTGDILHIRYVSWPGDARGHGPLEAAGARLLAARVLSRYGADLAANGGIPWAVLRHKFKLTEDQAQSLKSQWISSARSRMGAPAILDQDMELTPLNVTPKDMALNELQQFAEARVCVLLGVPPFLVGLPTGADSMTYTNGTAVYDFHYRRTLKPGSNYIMGALSQWALPRGTDIKLDAASYIRPGDVERAQYYQIMTEIGAMDVGEVRAAESLPALEVSSA
jgi:HK97 family phage portal protein